VQGVQQTFAVFEVGDVVQRLHVGHHALVGEGLLAVLVGDVDVPLAVHQVLDVLRADAEALDGVRRSGPPNP